MKDLLRTTVEGMARDLKSGALVAVDPKAAERFREERARQNVMNRLVRDVELLKEEMQTLSALIRQRCEK